ANALTGVAVRSRSQHSTFAVSNVSLSSSWLSIDTETNELLASQTGLTRQCQRDGDDEKGWIDDEEIRADGGTVLGFLATSHPQPWDNSQRLYTVDDSHITRPLVWLDKPAVGFYALTGESVVQFPTNQEKERICNCLEGIREQNPGQRILLVLDNFSSHVCEYTCKRAHQLGIDLVFLPVDSPDLNPIKQIWKNLKWEASPLIVESAAEYHTLLTEFFEKLTRQLSFVLY
uniref:IS630 family transposase n=1 Tax=Halarchaeum acidiphilum TaxID=489138 RepID=UPI001F4241EF